MLETVNMYMMMLVRHTNNMGRKIKRKLASLKVPYSESKKNTLISIFTDYQSSNLPDHILITKQSTQQDFREENVDH